jgi:hypothetical protein
MSRKKVTYMVKDKLTGQPCIINSGETMISYIEIGNIYPKSYR